MRSNWGTVMNIWDIYDAPEFAQNILQDTANAASHGRTATLDIKVAHNILGHPEIHIFRVTLEL